jgi:hypothetical protein
MKSSYIITAVGAAFALGGCVVAIGGDRDGHSISYTTDGQGYGSVYAADVDARAVSFTVKDNGCTDESFFDVDVRKTGENTFSIGLQRSREDYCEAYNEAGKKVSWSLRELGIPDGAQISVLNGVRR